MKIWSIFFSNFQLRYLEAEEKYNRSLKAYYNRVPIRKIRRPKSLTNLEICDEIQSKNDAKENYQKEEKISEPQSKDQNSGDEHEAQTESLQAKPEKMSEDSAKSRRDG